MKIVGVFHYYPPYRNAGSERMVHIMLRYLVEEGHEVEVVVTAMPETNGEAYELEGVKVIPGVPLYAARLNADVFVTHHENARPVAGIANVQDIPCVTILHNDFPHSKSMIRYAGKKDLIVFNTHWLAEKCKGLIRAGGRNGMVFHPPVISKEHKVEVQVAGYVTLVNLNRDKGSEIFYAVAERMPYLQFLGVVGAHGEQYIREDLPNVTILEHQRDMREVWKQTRLLLMPSVYESYGMVGPEAYASGIPVIACPTAGTKEALGDAGLFVRPRKNIDGWVNEVNAAIANYRGMYRLALQRSGELDYQLEWELTEWRNRIEALVFRHGSSLSDGGSEGSGG